MVLLKISVMEECDEEHNESSSDEDIDRMDIAHCYKTVSQGGLKSCKKYNLSNINMKSKE